MARAQTGEEIWDRIVWWEKQFCSLAKHLEGCSNNSKRLAWTIEGHWL
jgi:hypothetical protein